MIAKPLWQSKVLWWNALSLLVLILDTVQVSGSTVLPPAWLPYISLAVIVGNAILRFLTVQPVQLQGP